MMQYKTRQCLQGPRDSGVLNENPEDRVLGFAVWGLKVLESFSAKASGGLGA